MRPNPDSLPTPGHEDGEASSHSSRRSFLQRSVVATSAAVPAIMLANSSRADAQQAERFNPNIVPSLYPGWNRKNFHDILQHEKDHVEFLIALITQVAGAAAVHPMPVFNMAVMTQKNATQFVHTSMTLENTGTGAYLGALASISNTPVAQVAGKIALVEARHSGYLNTLLNARINTNVNNEAPSFELPLTQDRVFMNAKPFISDLNGPIGFQDGVHTRANDLAILNFALVLEYLEREFYMINVPRFFP